MNKNIIIVLGVCFILFAVTLTSAKGPPEGRPIKHTKAVGPAEHLYLYEKTPVAEDAWPIVEDGAWGKLITLRFYKMFFVFNGHQLIADTHYTLISYKEPGATWPATDCVILGTGIADGDGNVHIMGFMPPLVSNTYPTATSNEYSGIGAKIWLVLSGDMDGTTLQGWNPTDYLFEGRLLT
jgi:hypothetical protein